MFSTEHNILLITNYINWTDSKVGVTQNLQYSYIKSAAGKLST